MVSGLKVIEETEGTGAAAQKGDTLTFDCAAFLNKGSVVHERRTERLVLGSRRAIAGIEYALAGMREGGYRKVRISPHLAYGDAGVDGKVPPKAVLLYELWLKSVEKPTLAARKVAVVFALVFLLGAPSIDAHAQKKKAPGPAQVSCTSGPYRLQLPKTYKALRTMGQLRRERILKTDESGVLRELRFNGLELEVVTPPSKPNQYVVSRAIVTTRTWRIAGPLRVGTPVRGALKALQPKSVPNDGEVELNGEGDSIRVNVARGRVLDFEYSCNSDSES
jgi:FKBP-type peptidyl-prolyl isomerase-like protein